MLFAFILSLFQMTAMAAITPSGTQVVIDEIREIYAPAAQARGARFEVLIDEQKPGADAKAHHEDALWRITIFGGFIRHEFATPDSLRALLCHEVGHFLGGAPHFYTEQTWASSEGQADFFAASICLPHLFEDQDNQAAIVGLDIPDLVMNQCAFHSPNVKAQTICIRSAMAGYQLLYVFAVNPNVPPMFSLDPPYISKRTYEYHPGGQCRLTTYFRGVLGQDRPLCWYNPIDDERNH